MDIRIKSISLRNFKGTRDCTYTFDGRNARIEGANGSGKTTVFDAFTWLLFGKDSKDQTENTFEVKTIDPETGAPIPHLDHWVEAVLFVDGNQVTLRRCWNENWVKPTGEVTPVLKGNSTSYYINGHDAGTKKAYDQFVAQLMGEDVFRLITNPRYFVDDRFTGWQVRRKALMELVKDDPGRERVRKEFADVADKLSGRSIEAVRKQVAAEKRANKRDLDDTLARIAGMKEALPEKVDQAAVQAEIDAITEGADRELASVIEQIKEIDAAIADAGKAADAKKAENAAVWAEITAVQLKMGSYIADAKKEAQDKNAARQETILRVKANIAAKEATMKGEKAQAERARKELDALEQERGRIVSDLQALGERYKAEKAKAFDYTPDTRCPYCGQELPAASVEEAREKAHAAYLEKQRAAVKEITEKAAALKEEGHRMDARIAGTKEIISNSAEKYDLAETEAAKWGAELKRLEAAPAIDLIELEKELRDSEAVRAMQREEQELRLKAQRITARPDGMEEHMQRRAELQKQADDIRERCREAIEPLKGRLSVNRERDRQLELISRKEREAKNFADALAADERMEARLQAYVKADVDSVEEAINGLFRVARWKMFDQTLEGGLVETCEVCTKEGVPYRSMNDAMKTLCGLDVIRVFSERYGAQAPIFIDNAEGITATEFGTTSQVIRLVVADIPGIRVVEE